MTENEAKEYMENEIRCIERASYCDHDCAKCELVKEEEPLLKSFGMAIKALEEIQQYRAMEEKLNGISVKEVVNGFISAVEKETCEGYEHGRILTNEDAEKWNAYRAIGTVEEFKALKEKSVAKKIINKGQGHESDCYCPNCNKFLGDDQDWCFNQTKYCSECGQAFEEY